MNTDNSFVLVMLIIHVYLEVRLYSLHQYIMIIDANTGQIKQFCSY